MGFGDSNISSPEQMAYSVWPDKRWNLLLRLPAISYTPYALGFIVDLTYAPC